MQAVQGRAPLGVLTIGAGQATILPRQCDHVFTVQATKLLVNAIYYIRCGNFI